MGIRSSLSKFGNKLVNDDYRKWFTLILISAIATVVLAVATAYNFYNGANVQGFVFLAATIATLIIVFLTRFVRKQHRIFRYFFILTITTLFTYHLLDGGDNGVLLYWILFLPAFSFISFGLLEGIISAGSMFVVVLVVFWTPLFEILDLKYDPDFYFRIRFTIVYLICFIFGFVSEGIRYSTANQLKKTNEQLEFASLHDSLTGAANQNYLARYLDTISKNSAQEGYFGCLFIDVDGFKEVNDNYGHLFGNTVLCRIADILMQEKSAFVCRWGGDEFVACFNGTSEQELTNLAESFRVAVNKQTFEEHPDFHITISIGVSLLEVDESFNFNKVLEMTDVEMRHAKEKGKNAVSFKK